MARVDIPVVALDRDGADGIDPAASEVSGAPATDHSFRNDGRTILQIRNTIAGTRVVTIQTPNTVDGNLIADRAITIPASKTAIIGPFPRSVYNGADPDNSGDGGLDKDRVLVDIANSAGDLKFRAYRI